MPHDTQPARSSRDEVAAGMLQAPALAALAGIRHAFFTRDGGVSDGIYASLNGGPGSEDAPANVTENRARMAATLGVRPDRFLTAYQIHSPDVVTVERPWSAHERPRADAIVTRTPGLAIGVTTADCGPVLLADAAGRRHRRRPCRLARRRDRRARSNDRSDGAVRGRPRPHGGGARADDPPAELRGRTGIRRPLHGRRRNQRTFLPALAAAGPRAFRSSRLHRRATRARRRRARGGCRPLHLCRSDAVLQLPPVDPPAGARLRASHQCHSAGKLASRAHGASGHGCETHIPFHRTRGPRPGGWIGIAAPTGNSMQTGPCLRSARATAPQQAPVLRRHRACWCWDWRCRRASVAVSSRISPRPRARRLPSNRSRRRRPPMSRDL